jgi:cytochrome c553
MNGRKPHRAFLRVVAISGAMLLSHSVGTVEVESDAMQRRTAAAIADFRSAVELEPDLRHGAGLFTLCAACHGADGLGTGDGSVPAIAGQHVSVLVKQLVDFRHDRRWDERMQNFASQHHLSGPQEMLDVAAYAESLPRWPPLEGGAGDGAALQLGKVAYHRYCGNCHGPLGMGELRRMRPRLAGQRYQYLLRALEETATGMRPGMDPEHVKLIGALFTVERSGLADYLARLSPDLASTRDSAP